jgi:hypothetical protein
MEMKKAMPPPKPKPCRSCGAQMFWVTMASGARNCLDLEPVPEGNVVITTVIPDGTRLARTLKKDEPYEGPRFQSHFASCPDRMKWRKGGSK